MNVGGYDSNSISTLFSSLSNSNVGNSSAFPTGLYSSLSDLSMIRSGSYGKLVKTYYAKQDSADTDADTKIKNTAKQLANIEDSAKDLTESAQDLYKNTKLWKQKDDGSYQMDSIYDAVSAFVKDYNSAMAAAKKSDVTGIASSASSMVNFNNVNSSLLGRVGIKMDSDDYTLSIDEDKFKKSSIADLKSLFAGTGSYAYQIAAQASMMGNSAKIEAGKSNTYTVRGGYDQTLKAGSIYDANV